MSVIHRVWNVQREASFLRSQRKFFATALLVVLAVTSVVRAESLVPQGKPAPELSLTTFGGDAVQLPDSEGRIVLLLFGELYNKNSIDAAKEIAGILDEPAMAGVRASASMLVTQDASPAELLLEAKRKGITLPLVHDPSRWAFATYRVMVLPSLVVVGGDNLVVLSSAGYPLDFRDMVADTLLYASGKLSEQEFGRRRTPESTGAPAEQIRALRLAALGEQLMQRGAETLAIKSFRDAIALHPDCVSARIGLGTCLFNRRELAGAETHFLRALGAEPDSVEASLGLIGIQSARGGVELKDAQGRIAELLRRLPNDARVHYHAALVAEKIGDMDSAFGLYKRAAEIMLQRRQRESGP